MVLFTDTTVLRVAVGVVGLCGDIRNHFRFYQGYVRLRRTRGTPDDPTQTCSTDVDRYVYRDVNRYVYRDVDRDVYRDVDRYAYRDVDRNVIETSTDTFFETSTATSFAYETLS